MITMLAFLTARHELSALKGSLGLAWLDLSGELACGERSGWCGGRCGGCALQRAARPKVRHRCRREVRHRCRQRKFQKEKPPDTNGSCRERRSRVLERTNRASCLICAAAPVRPRNPPTLSVSKAVKRATFCFALSSSATEILLTVVSSALVTTRVPISMISTWRVCSSMGDLNPPPPQRRRPRPERP
jgi:hypothetical protein